MTAVTLAIRPPFQTKIRIITSQDGILWIIVFPHYGLLHSPKGEKTDTGFGSASTLGSRKSQTVLQKDEWFDFYLNSSFSLISTKDNYPHEGKRVLCTTHATIGFAFTHATIGFAFATTGSHVPWLRLFSLSFFTSLFSMNLWLLWTRCKNLLPD